MIASAHIETEHWDGARSRRERIETVTPSVLREQLSRLDGDRTDTLWIETDGVGALSVGGGPDWFIVVSFPSDGSSSHVEFEDHKGDPVEIQVGGQTGVFAAGMVLPADKAFEIAERFLSSGEYDRSVRWVQDCPPE